jgi:hypothetical protein
MSNHPLGDDLSKLSTDELDKKYGELMRRYTIARRMNMNEGVIHQLDIMLDGIEFERMNRMSKLDPNEDPVVLDTDRGTDGKSN